MPKKITKTQARRLYSSIASKTRKLFNQGWDQYMNVKDMTTILNIINKWHKKSVR